MIRNYDDMLKVLSDQIDELIETNKNIKIDAHEKRANIMTIGRLINLMLKIIEKAK